MVQCTLDFELDIVNINIRVSRNPVKLAQWAKVLATKTDNLNSIPETTMVEG